MDLMLNLPWYIKAVGIGMLLLVLIVRPIQKFISNHLKKNSAIKKNINDRLSVDNETARLIVRDIIKEARIIIRYLTTEEKKILRELNGRLSSPALYELFPDFDRSSEDHFNSRHELLRELRKCHLIRPVGGGRWRGDKRIELTAMGRLVIQLNKSKIN